MLNQVCLRTRSVEQGWTFAGYTSLGGYTQARALLGAGTPAETMIDTLKASGLRGRGGAGFPTGLKLSFMPSHKPGPRYLICNADESEPGTFKDREIVTVNPHQIIEGMLLAAYMIKAQTGYIYLRGEFADLPYQRLSAALQEARDAGIIGARACGSDFDFELHIVLGAGAYICGEETALMESLEGKKGMPRFKPPFPAGYGLYGHPTNINNVETLASIPVIFEKGAPWFAGLGTGKSGGTKVFSVSGHIARPGNYELPLGTPFAELFSLVGGMKNGRALKAVIPGGSSTPVLPAAKIMTCTLDYESLAAAGSMLGAGSLICIDDHTCMVKLLHRIAVFYHRESCGQCSPCREGTGWLVSLLENILNHQATMRDFDSLKQVAKDIKGRTICALGDAAAMPVLSFLEHFHEEFSHYIKHGRSLIVTP